MDTEKIYISSNPNDLFLCPYCSTDFTEKKLFIEHLKNQHPKEAKHIDVEGISKLEAYKQKKTNILNF